MRVDVSFTLDVDPTAWSGDSVEDEVRSHAENVVRDLFDDQGWTLQH
jgi:hypothetical protein